jgi:predicted ATP-grasp superfamily ATP-dependent carboligase
MISSPPTIREVTGDDLVRWDDWVRGFANHRVTHTRAWIESLEATGHGVPLYLVLEREGEVVACLPGLLASVAGWRLFGSPLPGWQTVSMGPAFDPARITTAELLGALIPYLEERYGVAHIELLTNALDADSMRSAGFEGQAVLTYRGTLFPGDEPRMLHSMKESARRNVRRAQRLGLVVRFEDDERFVDEHYAQLCEVYRRGGNAIPFTRERVLECFRRMKAAGNLLATSVYLPDGEISIATGMFLVEGNELLLWMWAHRPHYRWYRPTELMTWTAMQRATAAGCVTFDLMGGGHFKAKFGAEPDLTKWRWRRSRPRWLSVARDAAERGFRLQQSVRGRTALFAQRAIDAVTGGRGHARAPTRAEACVVGDIDLVRALGVGGISSVVVAPPGSASRYSRFARGALSWMDAWDHPEQLLSTLRNHALAQPEPPVLFYQDDRSLLLISRHREQLQRTFRFVIAEEALVEQLVDKAKFQELATRLGLPVPPARPVFPAGESPPRDVPYPSVLKPLTRRADRWTPIAGDAKAIPLDAPSALRDLWPRLVAADLPVLIQSVIPGPETRVESYHVYVDHHGDTVAEFTGRKIRTRPTAFGDSTALEITNADDVAAAGRDAVRRLRLRGVAKLDFKRGPDDRLYLLEVNPRFTLWHHLGAVAGVNIPALVYGDLLGWARPSIPRARAGVRWCKVWTDRAAARETGVPAADWLFWFLRCEAKSAIALDDPLPLLGAGLSRWLGRRHPVSPRSNGLHAPISTPHAHGRVLP